MRKKPTTRDDWKLRKMPKSYAKIPVSRRFSEREIEKINWVFVPTIWTKSGSSSMKKIACTYTEVAGCPLFVGFELVSRIATTTDVYMQEIPESVQKTVDAISAELRLLPNLEEVTHGTSVLLPNATKLKSGVSASS